MNDETIAVVDCLIDELALQVILQITTTNYELRRELPMADVLEDYVDMDVVLMNFPFLN